MKSLKRALLVIGVCALALVPALALAATPRRAADTRGKAGRSWDTPATRW